MRFRTTLHQSSKTATGIRVPEEVMSALNAGKGPKVAVTINGYTYRSSVATVNGGPMIGVSEAVRAATGVKGGDEIEVDVELDTEPRVLAIPDDLAAALDGDAAARATFDRLSYSNQRFWVDPITAAKSAETRARRVEKAVAALREGRAR
jgi:antitoxin component of MazEF toxin-antitoxin module